MSNKLILIGLLWSAYWWGPPIPPTSDWEEMRLHGKVSYISQRVYEARLSDSVVHKNNLKSDPLQNWDISFNKKGFITQKSCYDAANELLFYYDYKYKRRRRLIRKRMYDPRKYIMEEVKYVYNDMGQLAAESIYRADASLLVRYIHEYSPKGYRTQTDVHAPNPKYYSTSKYEFDYNKKGKLVCQRTFNREKLYQTDSFFYDKNNFEKAHKYTTHQDGFTFTSYSRYDEQGNLINFQAGGQDKPKTSFTYEYDSQGNWTTKLYFKNGRLQEIHERIIEYK